MTRFVVYAVKLPPDQPTRRPLEKGMYRSWVIVVDAPDMKAARAEMKCVLGEWPQAERGVYRIGAILQSTFLESAVAETFRIDHAEPPALE